MVRPKLASIIAISVEFKKDKESFAIKSNLTRTTSQQMKMIIHLMMFIFQLMMTAMLTMIQIRLMFPMLHRLLKIHHQTSQQMMTLQS